MMNLDLVEILEVYLDHVMHLIVPVDLNGQHHARLKDVLRVPGLLYAVARVRVCREAGPV